MPEIFISYARPDADSAQMVAQMLRAAGYEVWRDDELPAHRPYGEVIEERLRRSKAVVVLWSAHAVKSQWVRAEADLARNLATLAQGSLDGSIPPLPFNQIHCADLRGWPNECDTPGWHKILASIAEVVRLDPVVAETISSHPQMRDKPLLRVGPIVRANGLGSDDVERGFHDEIVVAFARQSTVSVAADDREAGSRGLDADYSVDGTIQRSGKRLRLAFRLTDRRANGQLWAERYDADADDLFGAQDRIALAVAGAVEAAIKTIEIERATRLPIDRLSVQQLYLRGLGAQRAQDREGCAAALAMFEQVIASDPTHAHALANAALCHYNIHFMGWWDDEARTRQAGADYALRSLRLSDSDAYSAGLCALVLAQFDHPIEVSLSLIDRLIGLNPALAVLWHWSGMLRLMAGDLALAETHFERCATLDPRTSVRPITLAGLGAARTLGGDFDAAISGLQESVRLRSRNSLAHIFLAVCYGLTGRTADARAALAAAAAIAPVDRFRLPIRDDTLRALFETGLRAARADWPADDARGRAVAVPAAGIEPATP